MSNILSAAQMAEFNEKGFTYARGLFAPDEVKLLTRAMEEDPAVRDSILDRRDGEGRSTRIALWNRAGDSVYGLAARYAPDGRHVGGAAGRPGLSLPVEAHGQGARSRRRLGMAPGLRLLVLQRLPAARPALGHDRARQDRPEQRLPADRHGLAPARPHRPHAAVADPERGRSQAHAAHPGEVPDRVLRARGRRRADLPLQRHPSLRRQPLGQPALDPADLLQPRRQRHLHQGRRPLLRAARAGRRRRASAAPACASPAATTRSTSPASPTCRTCARRRSRRRCSWTSAKSPRPTSKQPSTWRSATGGNIRSTSRHSGARPPTRPKTTRSFFTELLSEPGTFFLVATEGSQLQGFLIARKFPVPPVFAPGGEHLSGRRLLRPRTPSLADGRRGPALARLDADPRAQARPRSW